MAGLLATCVLAPAGLSAAPAHAAGGAAQCQADGGVYVYVQGGAQGCSSSPATGLAALESITSVHTIAGSGGFVCSIGGVGDCPKTTSQISMDNYWSYWWWQGYWKYATLGAMSHHPAPGSVEAWVRGNGQTAPSWTPPAPAAPPTTTQPTTTRPAAPVTTQPPAGAATTTSGTTHSTTHAPAAGTGSTSRAGSASRAASSAASTAASKAAAAASSAARSASHTPSASTNSSGTPSPSTSAISGTSMSEKSSRSATGSPWGVVVVAVLVVAAAVGGVIAVRRRR